MSEGENKPPFRDRRPGGKKPFSGPKPLGDKPRFSDKPRGERPYGRDGDRPRRPFGDKPRGDRPYGDKPSSDRPFRDGPRPGTAPRFNKGPGRDDRPSRPFGRDDRPSRPSRPFGEDRPSRPFRDDRPGSFRRNPEGSHTSKPSAEGPTARERPHLGEDELRYLGKNACMALFQKRSDDIVRIYVHREHAVEYKPLLDFCAQNRKSYHIVESIDLERLTDSVHHQGICIVAKARRFMSEKYFFTQLDAGRTLVLFLDGVANPHNLGAILRTAAHFGHKFVAVPMGELSKISPAIYRTAEGGAELVSIVQVEESEKFLDRLQSSGFHLYAFERGPASKSLFETRLNEKAVFVFGSEVEGLSGLVKAVVETKLEIPGTGAVESLNVSVAAAIAMAEFGKQGTQRTVRIVKSKPKS